MIAFLLLAALAFPPRQSTAQPHTSPPVEPEQVLAWQLEGLAQEEIREEVSARGLTEYPEIALLSALSAVGADAETIRVVQHAKGPRARWKLALKLPKPSDYLYEVAGALLWHDWEHALLTMQNAITAQPRDPDVHLVYAHLLSAVGDWIAAYGAATKAVALVPDWPYAHALRSTICYHSQIPQCALREAAAFLKLRPHDAVAYVALGHAECLQGNFAEALQAFEEAKRLNADYSEIYEGMGQVYGREREFEKATVAFEQAIRLGGQRADYRRELRRVCDAARQMLTPSPDITKACSDTWVRDADHSE
jgi:tetratricopeptide (TPR) repeat protein